MAQYVQKDKIKFRWHRYQSRINVFHDVLLKHKTNGTWQAYIGLVFNLTIINYNCSFFFD